MNRSRFIFILFTFAEYFIKHNCDNNNYTYNDKYCNHTRKHIFKIINKSHWVKGAEYAKQVIKHNTLPPDYIKKLRIRPPAITEAI